MSVSNARPDSSPEGASPAGRGYWFTPLPTYLLEAVYDPDSPVNAPAAILWAHIHRHYAWREKIFPSCATLAEETGLGERTIARLLQALRSAGALTWDAGFSSKGRSSNQYALAPFKPFEFDREPAPSVPAKNGNHQGEPAKSGSHRPAKSGSHPSAKNGRGIKSSSYLESTEGHLSPPVVAEAGDARGQGAVPEEREISASPDKPTTDGRENTPLIGSSSQSATTAQKLVQQAAVVDEHEEPAFIAWLTARHQPNGPGWWRQVARNGDFADLAATWRAERQPATQQPATATQQPATPPWCRDPDCDPVTRTRDREQPGGFRVSARCPDCHPDIAPTWAAPAKPTRGHQPWRNPTDPDAYNYDLCGRRLPDAQPSTAGRKSGAAFALADRLNTEGDRPA